MTNSPCYASLYQINTRDWQTGPAVQQVSRNKAGWRKEFEEMSRGRKSRRKSVERFISQIHR